MTPLLRPLLVSLALLFPLVNCDVTHDPIAESAACKLDFLAVKDHCKYSEHVKGNEGNNWLALECLQTRPGDTPLSEECDHYLWKFKLEITQGSFIEHASKVCAAEITQLRLCEDNKSSSGTFLACLVENKHATKNLSCRRFLERIQTLIFSDFRLIANFMHACQGAVERLGCGRTGHSENDRHSQGKTIACLQEKIEEVVEDDCKKEIFQISELQGESVELDSALVDACKEDMNRFCESLLEKAGGTGQVFDCLMVHKMNPGMTEACRVEVSRRQKLISRDYKVSTGLAKACKTDIKEHHCRKGLDENRVVSLSQILVCLEEARMEGATIAGECVGEMDEYRRSLMEDYSVTPELVKDCFKEIRKYCPTAEKGGKTIHCLMEISMNKNAESFLGESCQKTLDGFVREIQVDQDWSADPVLEAACLEVVTSSCDPKLGKDGVMACLMENMARDSKTMTGECRKVLMQIHYFLSREVLVDQELYKSCRKDAKKLCDSGDNWHHRHEDPLSKLVFPCLVRNLYNTEDSEEEDQEEEARPQIVSHECSEQVERILRLRASSVRLMPPVEQTCRDFLHAHCASYTGPGEEMNCLQENLHVLPTVCKAEVVKFTEIEAQNPYLHPNIFKACQAVIDENCGMEDKARDGRGVLSCLERYLIDNPPGSPNAMSQKCMTVVEHWEIMTLEDFHFSFEFKTSCKSEIKEHCKGKTAKYDMVNCLAAIIVDDTVEDQPHRIKQKCRDQIKLELLQKHSSLRLNPVLGKACKVEFSSLCPGKEGVEAVECLKDQNHKLLSAKCRSTLLGDQEEEAVNNQVDFPLMRSCKKEIKQHCSASNSSAIIDCLSEFAQDFDFDEKCLAVLKRRLTQHNGDYRLNTDLTRACRQDIQKYCGDILRENSDSFYEGKVLFCLREKYTKNVNLLARGCARQVQKMVRQSTLTVGNPVLEDKCPKTLRKCAISTNSKTPEGEEEFIVEQECMWKLFVSGSIPDGEECAQVLAVLAESQNRDVKADRPLFKACQLDLAKFCNDVTPGEGKRFACLVAVSKEKNFRLEPRCQEVVENRVAMYRVALQKHPMENAMDLYNAVLESPGRHYILATFFLVLAAIFCTGLCFGRVTRRFSSEIKNR